MAKGWNLYLIDMIALMFRFAVESASTSLPLLLNEDSPISVLLLLQRQMSF